MKDFLIGILATAAIIVACSSVETVWEPMPKLGGEGTQAVGESDLVLPGSGADRAATQEKSMEEQEVYSGMTDKEKIALISKMLDAAFDGSTTEPKDGYWEAVAIEIYSVVHFGGDG